MIYPGTPISPPGPTTALSLWVHGHIKQWISEGLLMPGDRLLERELSEVLAVSRVPVREALRLLQAEGYVTSVADKGMMVRALSRSEVVHMFELRGAIEDLSASLTACRADQETFTSLEQSLSSCADAIDRADGDGIRTHNREFHQLIRSASQNPFIPERMGPLVGRLEWAFRLSPEPRLVLQHHRQLFDAIVQKNTTKIRSLMAADNAYNLGMALWILSGEASEEYRGADHLNMSIDRDPCS